MAALMTMLRHIRLSVWIMETDLMGQGYGQQGAT